MRPLSRSGTPRRNDVMVRLAPGTPGDPVYFTTDGREPTATASLYTNKFQFLTTTVVKAKAIRSGANPSLTVSNQFTVQAMATLAAPVIKTPSGKYEDIVTVEIDPGPGGAKVYYTLDGSEPTERATPYGTPIPLKEAKTIKARAYQEGFKPSETASAAFTVIPVETTPQLVIDPAGGQSDLKLFSLGGLNYGDTMAQAERIFGPPTRQNYQTWLYQHSSRKVVIQFLLDNNVVYGWRVEWVY
jgi:hypothetical protein